MGGDEAPRGWIHGQPSGFAASPREAGRTRRPYVRTTIACERVPSRRGARALCGGESALARRHSGGTGDGRGGLGMGMNVSCVCVCVCERGARRPVRARGTLTHGTATSRRSDVWRDEIMELESAWDDRAIGLGGGTAHMWRVDTGPRIMETAGRKRPGAQRPTRRREANMRTSTATARGRSVMTDERHRTRGSHTQGGACVCVSCRNVSAVSPGSRSLLHLLTHTSLDATCEVCVCLVCSAARSYGSLFYPPIYA